MTWSPHPGSIPQTFLTDLGKLIFGGSGLRISIILGAFNYRRCCIEAGVNLLPLEGDSFDLEEADLEPFDDTTPLNLDELEVDTLLSHLSDKESEEEEEEGAFSADVGQSAPTLPSGPTINEETTSVAQGNEDVPSTQNDPPARAENEDIPARSGDENEPANQGNHLLRVPDLYSICLLELSCIFVHSRICFFVFLDLSSLFFNYSWIGL